MNITIKCTKEELLLIERALELYGRVALLQFSNLDLCDSLSRLLSKKNIHQEFDDEANKLKILFGYSSNSYPGVFNKEDVSDDARIAFHMYQQIRHERYKNRIKTGEQTNKHYTVDEFPADICNIAGIDLPKFEIEIE